ncbi:MAG: glycosyltransferase family 4 protein [Thermoleophilaceae bacterium]|nr:glycosyltransferase family 4 protein [Thermoleophilaceae bacterium]
MRVRVVDPPAYTPPYDHALCAALAAAGADVELVTSEFRHGPRPEPAGYALNDHFYRVGGPMPVKLAQHPIDMLRLRRLPRVDVTHFQWMPIQAIDRHLLPPGPTALTAHDVIPREPRPGQLGALGKTYNSVDAVIVHSRHGRDVLVEALDVEAAKVHVIPHGVFEHLTRVPDPKPLPPEFAAVEKPVVLQFGLMRPYKGIDLMLEGFAAADPDAELWLAGAARMDTEVLKRLARDLGIADRVRWIERFIGDDELGAYFERADVVALPYRQIDQSGVLFTALAFGKPMLLTRVGGFSEIADDHGAALAVAPDDLTAIARGLSELLGNEQERARLGAAAGALAQGEFAWSSIARSTLDLYASLA